MNEIEEIEKCLTGYLFSKDAADHNFLCKHHYRSMPEKIFARILFSDFFFKPEVIGWVKTQRGIFS